MEVDYNKIVIVNFLHYKNKLSIEEAEILYKDNKVYFDIVLDILGKDFISALLESISEKKANKKKGKKNNG